MRRRIGRATFVASVLAVALTSVAFACTAVTGSVHVEVTDRILSQGCAAEPGTQDCVGPGDTILLSAQNVPANTRYFMHFLNYQDLAHPAMACMGGTAGGAVGIGSVIIGGPVQATGWDIPETEGVIPPAAAAPEDPAGIDRGPALVCFIDVAQVNASQAAALTVI